MWITGQVCSREQRRGRYLPESLAHPGKMLPSIARYLINTYTDPGDWVCDPMAGIGTTLVEAATWAATPRRRVRGRVGRGWPRRTSATPIPRAPPAPGEVVTGDARRLPALLPAEVRGRIRLVVTSPPYGASTHGHVRTPGPRRGKIRKVDHRYGSDARTSRMSPTLTWLRASPGSSPASPRCCARGRSWPSPPARTAGTGNWSTSPGWSPPPGINAGLRLVEECAALIAGIRDGRLVARASFFQLKNIRDAQPHGDPQWLVQHEDVIIFGVRDRDLSRTQVLDG